jgi:hypothetical protein
VYLSTPVRSDGGITCRGARRGGRLRCRPVRRLRTDHHWRHQGHRGGRTPLLVVPSFHANRQISGTTRFVPAAAGWGGPTETSGGVGRTVNACNTGCTAPANRAPATGVAVLTA